MVTVALVLLIAIGAVVTWGAWHIPSEREHTMVSNNPKNKPELYTLAVVGVAMLIYAAIELVNAFVLP